MMSSFLKKQVSVVFFWIRVLSWLDSQGKSWTFTLISRKYLLRYFLRFSHRISPRTGQKSWTIEYNMKKEPFAEHGTLKFDNAIRFYEMFLFCLIRIPKGHIMIEMFNIGKRSVLQNETRWDLSVLRNRLEASTNPELQMPSIDAHPLPVHLGATVASDNFLVSYLNADFQHKRKILRDLHERSSDL
jgi:hypothetical protein